MSAHDRFKTYSHGDILAKEADIAIWELKLADALDKYNAATSGNCRHRAFVWNNVKNVLYSLRRELEEMRKAERS